MSPDVIAKIKECEVAVRNYEKKIEEFKVQHQPIFNIHGKHEYLNSRLEFMASTLTKRKAALRATYPNPDICAEFGLAGYQILYKEFQIRPATKLMKIQYFHPEQGWIANGKRNPIVWERFVIGSRECMLFHDRADETLYIGLR